MQSDLLNKKYNITAYKRFKITEPKERDIRATAYRDRIWQRALANVCVRKELTGGFIYDNGACQKLKGTDFCIERIITFLQKAYRECGSNNFYYCHIDIKKFFPSTPHIKTQELVKELIHDKDVANQIIKVIDSCTDDRTKEEISLDPFKDKGTLLGSELGQMLQLALLSKIDHVIKEKLGVKKYVRYNDDFLIISKDKNLISEVVAFISTETARLGLAVKNKSGIQNVKHHNIRFMKKVFIVLDTGKVLVKPNKKKFAEERKRLKSMKRKLNEGKTNMDKIEKHFQSWVGSIGKCDCDKQIKKMIVLYEELFGVKPTAIIPKKYRKHKKENKNV